MTADFSKLLNHPEKDEIISKLVTGVSPKNIADWLKLKYPDKDQTHLRVSAKNLKDFADNNIDLYNQLRNDIQGQSSGQQAPAKELAESLKNNKTYQERLNEIADTEIDIKQMIKETLMMIRARSIQVFDKIQENPQNMKPDYALIKWFDTLLVAIEKYDKIFNESPDQIVQHNITMKMVEDHTAIFQEAIRETMMEVDPEIAFLCMEKINEKLAMLNEPDTGILGQDKRLKEAKIISKITNNTDIEAEIEQDDTEES